jgi:hypothetical protein
MQMDLAHNLKKIQNVSGQHRRDQASQLKFQLTYIFQFYYTDSLATENIRSE